MAVMKTQRIDAPSPFAMAAPSKAGPVHARLYHIASQILDPLVARSELRKVAIAETGAVAAFHVSRTTEGQWTIDPAQITGDLPRDEGMRVQLMELCTAAAERGKPQIQQSKTAASLFLIGAPIVLPRTAGEVLLIVVPAQAGAVQAATMIIDLVAAYQRTWALTHIAAQMDRQLDSMATLCELTSKVTGAESLDAATTLLVNEVQRRFGCLRVAVGIKQGRSLRLAAVSGTSQADPTSTPVHRLRQAMQETLFRDEPAVWPVNASEAMLLAHQQLGQHCSFPAVISAPLKLADGAVVGVWLWAGAKEKLHSEAIRRFMAAASPHVAIALHACRRAEPGIASRMASALGRSLRSRAGMLVVLALMLFGGAMCVPVPSHVRCDCRVAPVARRYAVAPFDGQIETVLAKRGDTVTAGQILARLDGRQVRWELAGIEAERHQAARKHEVELVGQDVPEAILARLELDRLNVKDSQLTHRETQLEVTSPVSGIVLEGLRDRVEGTPVKTGDVLFEVAPLDRMRVEIEVPAGEVSTIEVGQTVTLWLEGLGSSELSGTIQSLAPESEVSEGENVFIAELEFENTQGRMRPGMRGRTRIDSPRRPLGRVLFQPFWEWWLSRWG